MRALKFLNIAVLSLLLGTAALVFGQDENKQEEKPARQEEAKPPKQDQAKPSRHEEGARQDKQVDKLEQKREESRDQAMPEKDKKDKQEHAGMKGEHARPAGKGGHIPDDKFRAHFGQGHHFNAKTVIVPGQTQFVFSGYTFELIDVWPADWAYTDDCYIDYIDGDYYLIDLFHPGVRIALFVVM